LMAVRGHPGHAHDVWARCSVEHHRRATVRFSGRTYSQLARIARALWAVAGRCCKRLADAVAVTVAVSGWSCPPSCLVDMLWWLLCPRCRSFPSWRPRV
jgi:hypothetical protein